MSTQSKLKLILSLMPNHIKILLFDNRFYFPGIPHQDKWKEVCVTVGPKKTNVKHWFTGPDKTCELIEFSLNNDLLLSYPAPFQFDNTTKVFTIMNTIGLNLQ